MCAHFGWLQLLCGETLAVVLVPVASCNREVYCNHPAQVCAASICQDVWRVRKVAHSISPVFTTFARGKKDQSRVWPRWRERERCGGSMFIALRFAKQFHAQQFNVQFKCTVAFLIFFYSFTCLFIDSFFFLYSFIYLLILVINWFVCKM